MGSSKRFCLATKDLGYSHCGVAAHGRTSKFLPKLDAFYVPGGIVSGRPTAMLNPYILRENVPRHMLAKFQQSSLKAEGWISLIQEAVLYDSIVADNDNDGSNGEEELVLGQSEEEESSTIASEIDEGEEESTFDFQWGEPLDEEDAESYPTASAHRKALVDAEVFRLPPALPRILAHIVNAATPDPSREIESPCPLDEPIPRAPIIRDGMLQLEGLFDVFVPSVPVACHCVFKAPG